MTLVFFSQQLKFWSNVKDSQVQGLLIVLRILPGGKMGLNNISNADY